MRPNKERLNQIRETQNVDLNWAHVGELFLEIDALERDQFHADQQYYNQHKATNEFQRRLKVLEEENADLRRKLESITGGINEILHISR